MAQRDEIIRFANELLEVDRFPEYGTPGLQVLGADEVTKIACGVSSSKELFERAAAAGAQLVLVHHGMFWRNEPVWIDRRQRGRLEALFAGDISLVAYHLALDAHPELGNNALLATRSASRSSDRSARSARAGRCPSRSGSTISPARVRETVGREPLVFAHGPDRIQRVAICSGGAAGELIRAAHEGYDLFLTGEPEEPSLQTARELGIHFVAAGHDATERARRPGARRSAGGALRPRLGVHPGREPRLDAQSLQRVDDGVRPLDDHEVAAVGDDAQLRAQPARVLEGVLERQLGVAGAPEDDDRARRARGGRDAGRPPTIASAADLRVHVLALRGEEPVRRAWALSAATSETNQGRKRARRYQTRSAKR